ncbi:MAG: NAD(P)/FAD-dependent oxidoreductase, partial [Pseudomonadota bacterium]
MNLSLFAGSPFFKAYGAELGRHGCEFVPVDRPFSSSFSDGAWAGVSTVGDETLAAFRALSPRDAETWSNLTSRFGQEAPHLFG